MLLKSVDKTLAIAISIPVLTIVLIALSIYIPQFFTNPKYDFLYLVDNSYYYEYTVNNGALIQNILPKNEYYRTSKEPQLFVYEVRNNRSKIISYEEAKNLTIDASNKSPDGYTIVNGSSDSEFFPFFFYTGTNYGTTYLKAGNFSKKIDLELDRGNYWNFKFLGWIIKN